MVNIKISLLVWPNHNLVSQVFSIATFDPPKYDFFFFLSIFYSYNNEEENSNACYSNKEEDSILS